MNLKGTSAIVGLAPHKDKVFELDNFSMLLKEQEAVKNEIFTINYVGEKQRALEPSLKSSIVFGEDQTARYSMDELVKSKISEPEYWSMKLKQVGLTTGNEEEPVEFEDVDTSFILVSNSIYTSLPETYFNTFMKKIVSLAECKAGEGEE